MVYVCVTLQGGLTGRKVGSGKSNRAGTTDPATYLQYQNQIKYMYRSETLSPSYGNEVSVVALSDSDTTASPTLGSSSASEKLRDLKNAESFNLSIDGRSESSISDKSDTKLYNLDARSSQSSRNGDDFDDTSADNETVIIHDDSDGSFKRNGENRNSDISDNSSVSQGIQADKDFSKHGSDMSDVSMSEGRLTPKNRQDLENYLQVTDESGIVSETTSSNHSETSQQSEHTSYRFDPSEIAQKIMSDVSEHKSALDSMQKFSMMQAQAESHIMRTEYQKQTQQLNQIPSDSNATTVNENVSNEQTSVQSKIAAFSGNTSNHSAFTSPSHKSRLPPPVASKPSFQSNASGFRNLSGNVLNLSSIPTSESVDEDTSISPSFNTHKHGNSATVPVAPASTSIFTTTAITVSKRDSFSSNTSASTTMSFSSFRPSGKPTLAESVVNASQLRPDSTTSTSSHCSTPSSMQSVIYRPCGDKRVPDSPCVMSYDSSSDQTSGSGSASTITPTVSMNDSLDTLQNTVISNLKRDSSPALSSCSSASGKSGKQKKKVSFSDSEPSDTPSPLDSSASSNQLSYFDFKKSTFGNIPPRAGNMQPTLQSQKSYQNSSNSSLDSAGKLTGNSHRPPPPSYQYAIRNSQMLQQNKSAQGKQGILQHSPRHSYSSNSSLNNSMDEVIRVPASHMSPIRTSGNQSNFPQQNQSESNDSYMLSQSIPSGSTFTQNYSQYPNPNQSYPPQNISSRVARNPAMSPVRNPGHSPVRSPGMSPVRQNPSAMKPASPEQTPVIPPRGIAPINRPNNMKLSDDPLSHGQSMQRSQISSGFVSQGQGHMSRSQLPPSQQYPSSRSNMSAIMEQIPNESSVRPNTLQMNNPNLSPTKSTVLRQPLSSPDANLSPQEYIPPTPDQFHGSNYLDSKQGQNAMPNSFNQMNYQRSQSMDFLSRNAKNDQNKQLSQSYEMKDFPSKFSSSHSLNQVSPVHSRGGPHIPSANHIRDTLVNNPANQVYVGQGATTRNTERRNPPVPPARIDSWENMDKHLNGLPSGQRTTFGHESNQPTNNSYQQFYGQNDKMGQNQNRSAIPNSPSKTANQNGYLPVREQTNQIFNSPTKSYPLNNTVPQNHQNFVNGNIPNLQLNPTNVGPLRRVGIGSDKKSFAKTNVIQASKC